MLGPKENKSIGLRGAGFNTNHSLPTIPYQPFLTNHSLPTIPHTNHSLVVGFGSGLRFENGPPNTWRIECWSSGRE
jgi:hypothetical protein